ncbi:MAG: flagellin [Lachnospiraceae bacterium]|nr:flagellin [Lachnospiraceae bacterium]
MSGISGISNNSYTALASGYRINSAADDAAGLAISQKLTSQENGYNVGTENAQMGQNLLNVADGALSGIQDNLQRIRELSVKSMNGLYGDDDRQMIQREIDGLLQNVQDIAKGTTFNTMKLLDGSMADIDLATNPQGGGLSIKMVNSTLESLGIADYDVTKDFDLDAIDKAIDTISGARSRIGAQTNALTHTMNYNDYSSLNLASANSRIKDTDYGEEVIKKNRDEALEQYRLFGIKAKMNDDAGILKLLS